jgi:hypothetical protein
MSGPWEKYGSSDGPWAKYAAAPPHEPQDKGAAAQFGAGALESGLTALGQAAQFSPSALVGRVLKAMPGHIDNGATRAPDIAMNGSPAIADAMAGKPQGIVSSGMRTLGQFAPGAVAPGTIPQRIANVVLPATGSEAAGQLTAGTPLEGPARFLGALFGGGFAPSVADRAQFQVQQARAPKPVLPAGPDVSQGMARKAANYVQSLAEGRDPATIGSVASPATGAEALGKPGEVALGSLARRPGQTADLLSGIVSNRQLGRPDRLLGAAQDATGISPEAAQGNIEAMVQAGRKAAGPLYKQAYAVGGVDSPKLQSMMSRPSMRSALSNAAGIAAEEGRNPSELGFKIETQRVPGGGSTDVVSAVSNPTAETWDYVKRALDDGIESYRDKLTGKLNLDEQGRAQLSTLTDMRNELRTQNPAYAAALDASGDYMSLNQAYRDGGKMIADARLTEKQFADRLSAMTPSQRDAFKGGIANSYYDLAQNGKLDPRVLKTPRTRAKLTAALGESGAKALIDQAQIEAAFQGFERRAPGSGSPTAEYSAEMGRQDVIGGGPAMVSDFGSRVMKGQGVRSAAIGAVANKVQDIVALHHTMGMPQGARDEAGRLLAGSPQDLAQYLQSLPPASLPPALRPRLQGGLFGSLASPSRAPAR